MFAKVFEQIFDSSIADNYQLRHFFIDMLVLADSDGVVDMTASAIAARTRIELAKVTEFLAVLESPDSESRTRIAEGRRIVKLDDQRSWGWQIVNYAYFRNLSRDIDRREKTKERVRSFRERTEIQEQQEFATCNSPSVTRRYIATSASPSASQEKGGIGGRMKRPDLQEVMAYTRTLELPDSDAEWFFHKCEGNGWTNAGRPIQRWKSTISSWKAGKYLPSQKNETNKTNPRNSGFKQDAASKGAEVAAALERRKQTQA